MKRIRTLATGLLLLALFAPSVYASGTGAEWEILNQEVMELYQNGHYARAMVIAQTALDVATKNTGPNHPSRCGH